MTRRSICFLLALCLLPLALPGLAMAAGMRGLGRELNGAARSPHRGMDLEAGTGERVARTCTSGFRPWAGWWTPRLSFYMVPFHN